ncbi:MAG: hypothetical protein Q4C82_04585 [Eubacteriales bacterium]|nr:hypothetical protein [Eubacteriales bacterium]
MNRKRWEIGLGVVSLACALQLAQWTLIHVYGLELRSMAQTAKGVFLWLLVPLVLLGLLIGDAQRLRTLAGKLLLGAGIFVILLTGAVRTVAYVASGEYEAEAVLPDGYLRCTPVYFLDVGNSRICEPYGLLFRRPFQGWSEEQLDEKIRETYGDDVRRDGTASDGTSAVCVGKSRDPGAEPFYFTVSNMYDLSDNYLSQLMKADAVRFWSTKSRWAAFSADGSGGWTVELDEQAYGRSQAEAEPSVLTVSCASEDAAVCAGDLADWLLYVREDARYWKNGQMAADAGLSVVDLSTPDGMVRIFLDRELFSLAQGASWETLQASLLETLTDAFSSGDGSESGSEDDGDRDDGWQEAYLAGYTGDYEQECTVGESGTVYRMTVLDAALGHRAYLLLISTDGGATWDIQNGEPFPEMGMGVAFTFLDEQLGFASLTHGGGDSADLYVTQDGGKSYAPVAIEGFSVTLEGGYRYDPYDFPEMPYLEDGRLFVLCGQGADGDYAGGDGAGLALYESTDGGRTFLYQGVQAPDQP